MHELHESGAIAQMAVAELEKQLPEIIKSRIQSALYSVDFSKVVGPAIDAAIDAVLQSTKKR
jgi:hypothetical protein